MNKRLSLLLLSASMLLVACNNNPAPAATTTEDINEISIAVAGPTSVEVGKTIKLNVTLKNDTERLGYDVKSSDTKIATVDAEGRVTGVKVGSVVITVSSSKDPTVTAEYAVEVVESTIPSLSIQGDRDLIVLGSGTLRFIANLFNPTPYEPEYCWSSSNGNVTVIGARSDVGIFQTVNAGTDTVRLDVHVGPYVLSAEADITIQPNYEDGTWVSITSADLFKEKLLTGNKITGNYALDADIDLDGLAIEYNSRDFAGVLEGKGHTISNFSVKGTLDGAGDIYNSAGMWGNVSGAIRDVGFQGEIGELGSGWGGAIIAATATGVLENIFVDVDHSFDNGKKQREGWVAFNAALVGVVKEGARLHDLVINVADTEGKATIYADTAYPAGAGSAQTFEIDNLYTNTTVVGGQHWDWGNIVADMSGYYTGINFESKKASFYHLNSRIWDVEDNKMPTLIVRD